MIMDDSTIKLITIIIALYAAVISTLVLVWNIFIYRKDKGKLKVNCYFGREFGDNFQSEIELHFWITNIGRRDIIVTNLVCIDHNKKNYLIFAGNNNSPKLPKTLKPGEFVVEQIKNYEGISKIKIKKLYVSDSIGNKYFVSKKEITKLLLEFHKMEK